MSEERRFHVHRDYAVGVYGGYVIYDMATGAGVITVEGNHDYSGTDVVRGIAEAERRAHQIADMLEREEGPL